MGQARHLGCDLLQVASQVWRDERFKCSAIDPKGRAAKVLVLENSRLKPILAETMLDVAVLTRRVAKPTCKQHTGAT